MIITSRKDVNFITGYNPSHLAGAGDIIESAAQLLGSTITNYDLDNILFQIHPQITTRKILLLGHSQGTFYTNEIYKYLTYNGEPEESVAVYNVAMPASFVAGGGNYLTSSNDKVINAVRAAVATKFGTTLRAEQPLPANISIPLTEQEAADPYGGHSFSGVYLANVASRIVSDVGDALKKLVAGEVQDTDGGETGCFTAPLKDAKYYSEKVAFAVGDTLTTGVVEANKDIAAAGKIAYNGAATITQSAAAAAETAYANIEKLFVNIPRGPALVADYFGNSRQPNAGGTISSGNNEQNGTENLSQSAQNAAANAENRSAIISQGPSAAGANIFSSGATASNEADSQSNDRSQRENNSVAVAAENFSSNEVATISGASPANQDSVNQAQIFSGGGGGGGNGSGNNGGGNQNSAANSSASESSNSETSNASASSSSPAASSSVSLALTEIMYNASGTDAGREWVEIFNSGSSSVDIAKLKFFESGTNHNLNVAQGTTVLASGDYAVLADNASTFLSDYPSYIGQLFDSSFSLSNNGETIALKNGGAVVDEVMYVSSTGANGDGNSLQLIGGVWLAAAPTPGRANATSSSGTAGSTSSSTASVASSTLSSASSTSGETPSSTNNSASSGVAHILISEILFNASGTDAGKEFIELYNPNASSADVGGWSLKYREQGATSTVSLASFKSSSHQEDATLMRPKGFLLIGLNDYDSANYGGRTADILRTTSLPNGESGGSPQTITIMLFNGSGSEIDRIAYDKNSIASEGQSLERKIAQDGACASAQGNGEFLGNDCDTDADSDFEIRSAPNPQNSNSLPEPRSAPEINNFRITYDFAPQFDFSWNSSEDAVGATSTLSYFISDVSGASSSILLFETASAASTTFSYPVGEVGRDYEFQFKARDRDGLSSISTSTVAAKSFLDKFYFYRSPLPSSTEYLFDLTTTSSRPFWDKSDTGTAQNWKAIVFYLNKDAPKQGELSTDNQLAPSDGSYVRIGYDGCGGGAGNSSELIFPVNNYSCQPGTLSAGAYTFTKLEDARLRVGLSSSTLDASFSPDDYVTLAFYDFSGGEGGSRRLRLAAVDKTKYHFQSSPAVQSAPTTPGNFSADFNSASGKLNLTWTSSTDSDTLDSLIHYETNYSTSTMFDDSAWGSVSNILSASFIPAFPNNYELGVRAVDDFGNASRPSTFNWSFPSGFALLPSQLNHDAAIGTDGGGQKIFMEYAATINGAAFFAGPNGGSYCCSQSYLEIRRDNNGSLGELIATSTPRTLSQYDDPHKLLYDFSPAVFLDASSSYWLMVSTGPSATTNGTKIYGTLSDSYANGFWSERPGADAYFILTQQ